MARKIKNIFSDESIEQDKQNFIRRLKEYIKKYEGTDADLEPTKHLVEKLERRNNPSGVMAAWTNKLGYVAIPNASIGNVVAKGLVPKFQPEVGRCILFTTNPNVAKTKGGTLLRFPLYPELDYKLLKNGPYEYNHCAFTSIHRRWLEVYISGDVGDDSNWMPVGALR